MYIHAKVQANSKEEKIEKKSETHFVVWVKEKPERNEANRRVVSIFKKLFNLKKVRIVNGHNSPSKLLVVDIE